MMKSAYCDDPIEKLKWVIVASITCNIITNVFLKPFSPFLGETCQTYCNKTHTKIYAEQISE